jgi:hypothetical protein
VVALFEAGYNSGESTCTGGYPVTGDPAGPETSVGLFCELGVPVPQSFFVAKFSARESAELPARAGRTRVGVIGVSASMGVGGNENLSLSGGVTTRPSLRGDGFWTAGDVGGEGGSLGELFADATRFPRLAALSSEQPKPIKGTSTQINSISKRVQIINY